jgi:hypothetical protein
MASKKSNSAKDKVKKSDSIAGHSSQEESPRLQTRLKVDTSTKQEMKPELKNPEDTVLEASCQHIFESRSKIKTSVQKEELMPSDSKSPLSTASTKAERNRRKKETEKKRKAQEIQK